MRGLDPKENYSWKEIIKFLWSHGEQDRWKFVILSVILFILQLYVLVPALIVARIITLLKDYDPANFNQIIILALSLGILNFIVAQTRLSIRQINSIYFRDLMFRIKLAGFNQLIEFPLKWHEKENTGNKIQRLMSGTDSVKVLGMQFMTGGSGILANSAAIIGALVAFLVISPIYFIFGFSFIFIFFYIHFRFIRHIESKIIERNKKNENASGKFFEGVNNVLTIKSLGAKDTFKGKINQTEKENRDFDVEVRKLNIKKRKWFQTEISFGLSLFMLLLVLSITGGTFGIELLFIYWSYFNQIIDKSWDSTDLIDELQDVRLSISRMLPIFDPLSVSKGTKEFPKSWKKISIKDANFKYIQGKDEFEMHDLTIDIERNQKIGIVGVSGSGKSTLVKLLLGLYKLEKGEYKIGDEDFYSIAPEEISKNISIVLQESELFNFSLLENITLLGNVDESLLEKSINISQLKTLVDKLPLGLNSLIGEKGYKVSGGERQRIGIARAIYKNTDILILDEATSNLDSKTERAFQTQLEEQFDKKTIIIVAHRLSTLEGVDKIYVFDKGRIIEQGRFEELMKNRGKFFELYNIQSKKQI